MKVQYGNGILEISIKVLCWETGAGGLSVRSVLVPFCVVGLCCTQLQAGTGAKICRTHFFKCVMRSISFLLTYCSWRPGKILLVWGIAEEMFYT